MESVTKIVRKAKGKPAVMKWIEPTEEKDRIGLTETRASLPRTRRQRSTPDGSITRGHLLKLFAQRFPVLRLQLGVLDSFLAPILMKPTDVML